MSADEQSTSEAAETPVEEQEYEVKLSVRGYITLYTMAASQEDADTWAEGCDFDPADLQISDVEVEWVEPMEEGAA